MNDLVVGLLTPSDALALSGLLLADDGAYGKFFTPFAADLESVKAMLSSVKDDRYWGFWAADKLVGFFMLRGRDEGYERPSFGVYIAKSHTKRGLSKLALEYSMCWCRLNEIRALMLKVHPDNRFARQAYERAGFRFVETCPRTGHNVMEISWSE